MDSLSKRILVLMTLAILLLAGLATPVLAEEAKSKLEVHGFLTQAYVTGSFLEGRFPNPDGSPAGPTSSELQIGIPEDGSFDYRNMALQFRYAISDKDIMIVQLSSRSHGISPITIAEDEIEVDWAFYERRLGEDTSVKVGRVQIPNGIFNEIRDVGTVLPFFRPSFSIYQEGAFTSETVDGLNLSHTFAAESNWSVDADFYFGQWELSELDFATNISLVAKAKDSWGTQLWLNTPVGLRFGTAFQQRQISEGFLRRPGDETKFDDWLFSVDAPFEKWVFRAEYRKLETEPQPIPLFLASDYVFKVDAYYFQLGYHLSDNFRIYLQYEDSYLRTNAESFTEPTDNQIRQDVGLALNILLSPSVVIKAEYHEVKGEDSTFLPTFGPTGFKLAPIYRDLDGGDYTIISLSASF